jgi:uncharacterized protein
MNDNNNILRVHSSIYNVYLDDSDNGNKYIFNTWKGNLAEVEREVYECIKNKKIDLINQHKIAELINTGFLTSYENEFEEVLKENSLMLEKKQNFSIVIALTSYCNANCSYCFEKNIVKTNLSEKNIDTVCEYIIKCSEGRNTHITWFGGEPLLNTKGISIITDKLKKANVNFVSSIITNGYYLDRYASNFIDWNIKRAQITIDGLHEEYDMVKNYNEEGHSAFDKIINNIHIALENNIRIVVRVNFDASKCDDYKMIINFMNKEFGQKIRLYFHDIFGQDFVLANTLDNNPHVRILHELSKNGYVKTLRDLKIIRKYTSCGIHKPNFIALSPDGSAVKCEHYIGRTNTIFNLGNISDPNFNPSIVLNSLQYECKTCRCFPICSGGCLASWMEKPRGGCLPIKNALSEILLIYVKEVYENEVVNNRL